MPPSLGQCWFHEALCMNTIGRSSSAGSQWGIVRWWCSSNETANVDHVIKVCFRCPTWHRYRVVFYLSNGLQIFLHIKCYFSQFPTFNSTNEIISAFIVVFLLRIVCKTIVPFAIYSILSRSTLIMDHFWLLFRPHDAAFHIEVVFRVVLTHVSKLKTAFFYNFHSYCWIDKVFQRLSSLLIVLHNHYMCC